MEKTMKSEGSPRESGQETPEYLPKTASEKKAERDEIKGLLDESLSKAKKKAEAVKDEESATKFRRIRQLRKNILNLDSYSSKDKKSEILQQAKESFIEWQETTIDQLEDGVLSEATQDDLLAYAEGIAQAVARDSGLSEIEVLKHLTSDPEYSKNTTKIERISQQKFIERQREQLNLFKQQAEGIITNAHTAIGEGVVDYPSQKKLDDELQLLAESFGPYTEYTEEQLIKILREEICSHETCSHLVTRGQEVLFARAVDTIPEDQGVQNRGAAIEQIRVSLKEQGVEEEDVDKIMEMTAHPKQGQEGLLEKKLEGIFLKSLPDNEVRYVLEKVYNSSEEGVRSDMLKQLRKHSGRSFVHISPEVLDDSMTREQKKFLLSTLMSRKRKGNDRVDEYERSLEVLLETDELFEPLIFDELEGVSSRARIGLLAWKNMLDGSYFPKPKEYTGLKKYLLIPESPADPFRELDERIRKTPNKVQAEEIDQFFDEKRNDPDFEGFHWALGQVHRIFKLIHRREQRKFKKATVNKKAREGGAHGATMGAKKVRLVIDLKEFLDQENDKSFAFSNELVNEKMHAGLDQVYGPGNWNDRQAELLREEVVSKDHQREIIDAMHEQYINPIVKRVQGESGQIDIGLVHDEIQIMLKEKGVSEEEIEHISLQAILENKLLTGAVGEQLTSHPEFREIARQFVKNKEGGGDKMSVDHAMLFSGEDFMREHGKYSSLGYAPDALWKREINGASNGTIDKTLVKLVIELLRTGKTYGWNKSIDYNGWSKSTQKVRDELFLYSLGLALLMGADEKLSRLMKEEPEIFGEWGQESGLNTWTQFVDGSFYLKHAPEEGRKAQEIISNLLERIKDNPEDALRDDLSRAKGDILRPVYRKQEQLEKKEGRDSLKVKELNRAIEHMGRIDLFLQAMWIQETRKRHNLKQETQQET